jgi:tetraprenyl-beta-curcumene synthase
MSTYKCSTISTLSKFGVDSVRVGVFAMKTIEYEKQLSFGIKYIKKVLPEVYRQLKTVSAKFADSAAAVRYSKELTDPLINKLAIECGSVFSLYPKVDMKSTITFIVSMQGICDYLTNLCTTLALTDEAAIRQLHLSMLDAVDPDRTAGNYYMYSPCKSNRAYLKSLVDTCRLQIVNLPSYTLVLGKIKKYIQLYIDLQAYKRLPGNAREEYIKIWSDYYMRQFPDISFWEFAAAADSTMGIYIMFASAFDSQLTPHDIKMIDDTYFPWMCGLQKLLDSYIKAREDMLTDNLNFTDFYKNLKQCEERLTFFTERAAGNCLSLPNPEFHLTTLKVLLAMYLSDHRAFFGLYRLSSRHILLKAPSYTGIYWSSCRILKCIQR